MNRARPLLAVSRPRRHAFPTGSYAHMITGAELGQTLDPFIQIDHFHMAHPTFPPHPHAGMSAVTYMLDDAQTGFVNRDSLGDRSLIRAGDLHWTQAGSGMMHEEVPEVTGRWAHGLQVFVNLASEHKQARPQAFHLLAQERPVVQLPGAQVRVVAGELQGHRSPVTELLLTPAHLYDVQGEGGRSVEIPLHAPTFNAFIVVLGGDLVADGVSLDAGMVGHFGRDAGEGIRVEVGSAGAWWVMMSGEPIDEPVVAHGPFVGNSQGDIAGYLQRYRQGHMGTLAPSF